MDANEVKKKLCENAENVCMHLLPNGIRKSDEWCVGSLSGESGQSLRVRLSGDKCGIWKDFSDEESGDNLLQLWVQCKNITFVEALTEAKDYLGYKDVSKNLVVAPKTYETPKLRDAKPVSNVYNKKAYEYLTVERNLSYDSLTEFKVMTSGHIESTTSGDIVFPYYSMDGELEMIKYLSLNRKEGRKMMFSSRNTRKTLFGKNAVSDESSTIVITEGEIDAISFHQAGIDAVSVPFGAKWENKLGNDPNMEWIENDWDFLERFDQIIISMDMDEAGKKASQSIASRLGSHRTKILALPYKDANECILRDGNSVLKDAVEKILNQDPDNLKNAYLYYEDARELIYHPDDEVTKGIPLPWEMDFHIRPHEMTVVAGYNGSGKTMILNFIMSWFRSLDKRVCIASLEVVPKQTLVQIVRQVVGAETPSEQEFEDAMKWVGEGFWFYDKVGHADENDLLETFKYAHRRYGVTIFVIDSFMKCGFDIDDYRAHKKFMDSLADFVHEHGCHLFLVAHARKKDSEHQKVDKHDVKGISEITDIAHNVVTVFRNKKKEAEVNELMQSGDEALAEARRKEKPDSTLSVVKQRNGYGDEPFIRLWYNKNNRQFTDNPEAEPFKFIEDV